MTSSARIANHVHVLVRPPKVPPRLHLPVPVALGRVHGPAVGRRVQVARHLLRVGLLLGPPQQRAGRALALVGRVRGNQLEVPVRLLLARVRRVRHVAPVLPLQVVEELDGRVRVAVARPGVARRHGRDGVCGLAGRVPDGKRHNGLGARVGRRRLHDADVHVVLGEVVGQVLPPKRPHLRRRRREHHLLHAVVGKGGHVDLDQLVHVVDRAGAHRESHCGVWCVVCLL
ncbi:hypothetical protein SPBR_05303 [Sporothrix brasiliensis 5110]|uniref:Uncharacterized protein n=1 Tax=Sporothrix brasiliensis 5110 TaxID=1398154 RepID=A0A0C2IJN2_9PEZI|nr:uncharacterized protein SPBR_05303 [Sporothrix brasiliensis 5110]KIH87135.1 hypothetical protein SPBR_05303 [Sporothrix brasiliensis 5110]